MNSKTTGIWFVIAAALLAFIFIFEHYLRPVVAKAGTLAQLRPPPSRAFKSFRPARWKSAPTAPTAAGNLTRPVIYPAQTAAIETLLDTLQKLVPATRISAAELREQKNPEAEFGFENPQATLVIEAGDQSWQLKVGNKTAPGDQVYLRVVGVDGVFVADAGWLKFDSPPGR